MNVEEMLQQAAVRAEAGDLDGELDALLRADALGDAEAAVLLGTRLRHKGDSEGARAAFERAEKRGHREAAMSLGNLLSDLGDIDGARTAYRRSIDLGSTLASLNFGLMLADEKEFDEALVHLQRAADSGEVTSYWAIGRIREQGGDPSAARDAFRSGSDRGDRDCAYALGASLFEDGDRDGALRAFERAVSLGHEKASDVLTALTSDGGGAETPAPSPNVEQLWSDATAVLEALASTRQELGRRWISATLELQERQSQLAAMNSAQQHFGKQISAVCTRFEIPQMLATHETGRQPGVREERNSGDLATDWLEASAGQAGPWTLSVRQSKAFEADLADARTAFSQAETKRLGSGLRRQGAEALSRAHERLGALTRAIRVMSEQVGRAEHAREAVAKDAAERARDRFEPVASLAATSGCQLPTVLQPWSSPAWASWRVGDPSNLGLRLAFGGTLAPKPDARLGLNAGFGTDVRVPWGFALHASWWLQHDAASRLSTHRFVRSIMVRHLLTVRPGEIKFCVFDPVGLGQSAGELLDLAEYDADLIGGKIWSSPQDLDARLVELSAHIELVIQKYLRSTYQTIDEFNAEAGEVAEPYRLLVLFDTPTGLSPEGAARLKSIVENGPRCGVFVLIAADSTVAAPYGVDTNQISTSMRRLDLRGEFADNVNGYKLETALEHDRLPEESGLVRRVIDGVGRASIARAETAVTFENVFAMYGGVAARGLRPELGTAPATTRLENPETWWQGDSTRGLFAPIGRKGARDVAVLGFDSSDRSGALLVGRPGSGKSTLLHAYIGGLTSLYGPDELELYLIDFKEGVEFKAYAEERLPHAKVIAIESDREFGLSVLESLQAEISQRAELLRSTGGRQAGMQALRESRGDKIPRILLVFDEFQVLFARNDKVGLAAADLLESVIRQGRGFGVHVLLGSQSLAGMDALGAHVPQLLPVRILLPAAESDARKVLSDGNDAGDYLSGHGEGILNSAGGAVEANERFKGALLAEADRVARLQLMRRKADAAGFARTPMIFEGNSLVGLDSQNPKLFNEELASSGGNPIRVRFGKPMTIGDLGDLRLSREAGSNVLAILRGGDGESAGVDTCAGPAYGLLAAAVASVAMTAASVDVVDFMPNDDGLDGLFDPLLDARRITLKRRRAFPEVLSSYVDEVNERVRNDINNQPGRVLFLFGVHRARDLESDIGGALDGDADLVEQLEQVMRDGPEVGIHVWLWSDSVTGVSRRLTSRMMREVAWRIAGKMSADDSQSFVGTSAAADLRESQLLMVNEDRGVSTRVTAYAPPSPRWVSEITEATLT